MGYEAVFECNMATVVGSGVLDWVKVLAWACETARLSLCLTNGVIVACCPLVKTQGSGVLVCLMNFQ